MSTRRTLRDLADVTERLGNFTYEVAQSADEPVAEHLDRALAGLDDALEAFERAVKEVEPVAITPAPRAHVDELLEIAAEAREDRRRQEAAEEADWAGVARAFEPEVEEARHG